MITELYMEGYKIDVGADLPALMNFAIDDVKDFSSRSTSWSKTVVLPGTSNNNKLFGNIFQVGQANYYNASLPNVNSNFNAAKSAQVIIFQDQMQTFQGVLRLLQINISNGFQGKVEYEVQLVGNIYSLNYALSSALLETLDFSAYDHVYNDSNIVNSWDNPGGTGVYYPLIDYGTYSTDKHNWEIHTFRPSLYVREYIDKIFAAAGYRWDCALFDSPRFKSLVIPHSKKTMTVNLTNLYAAHNIVDFYGTPPAPPIGVITGGVLVRFNLISGTGFTANGAKTIFTFNGLATTNVNLIFKFTGHFSPSGGFDTYSLILWKNGEGTTFVYSVGGFNSPFSLGDGITVPISLAPGDTIEWRLTQGSTGAITNFQLDTSDFSITSQGASGVAVPIQFGDTVKVNDQIPQNIRRIDLLVGLVKLFNLYVLEDKQDPFLIHITPYIDFYSKNTANAIDWTYKLNRNKITKVLPMSELNAKIYNFKFKSDSDYYNDLYRKRYNEGYGDRIYDSQFEFSEQEKSFEILFSSTPLIGYGGEDKVYPTIFKRTGSDASPTEENTDSNIRILQTKKITGITAWDMKNGATVINTLTKYGYAGHLDDPKTPTSDLNFGATKELFFILNGGNLSNNQFNVYWSGYMAEITDKNSKLVTGNFYLNAKDILNLDFSKYIYVDGIAYRLNAIKDYNTIKPDDCIVELLKVNLSAYSEAAPDSGPPDGCFLLWSDENTLDDDTGDPLLYDSCQGNPGDGDTTGGSGGGVAPPPPPPTVFYLNWNFTKNSRTGVIRVYQNSVLQGFSTVTNTGIPLVINAGDLIKVNATGSFGSGHFVTLVISNDVDGVIYSHSSILTLETTFTVVANRNYNITAVAN